MRATLKKVLGVSILLLILCKMVDVSLIYANADTVKSSTTGKTVSVFVHGRTVFITPDQAQRLTHLHWVSGVFVLLVLGYVVVTVTDRNFKGES